MYGIHYMELKDHEGPSVIKDYVVGIHYMELKDHPRRTYPQTHQRIHYMELKVDVFGGILVRQQF